MEAREIRDLGQFGVFAARPLKEAERLAVFGGHVMNVHDEPPGDYALQIAEDLVIGLPNPTHDEPGEYFNHSCNPNAGFKGQICLVALRAIAAGEAVCFDYAMVLSKPDNRFECRCGTPRCRGAVTGEDWKDPELQRRYTGFFSLYLQEKIDSTKIK